MSAVHKTKIKSPIAIEWTIPEHRLKEYKNKPGGVLRSTSFNATQIPGVQYYIDMYTNSQLENQIGETWIYLYLKNANKTKIEANFIIEIESANYSREGKLVFEDATGVSFEKCCKMEDLFDHEKKFIIDGKMTIRMKGTLVIEKEIPDTNEKFGDHRDVLCLGLWNQENKDFTIIVDGKEITAHKCVLSTFSPVFARMFETKMKESQENKVEIKDFLFETVEMGIKFCYHQSLVTYASLEDKMKLLQFFDKYDIQQLKYDLETYLITVINELTVCRLTNASLLSNAVKLKMKCSEFLQNCLKSKPVSDLDILDKDFALNLFKKAFSNVSKYNPFSVK